MSNDDTSLDTTITNSPSEAVSSQAASASASSPLRADADTASALDMSSSGSSGGSPSRAVPRSLRWTTADIAVGAALGVACGLVFWGFNYAYVVISPVLRDLLPGIASVLHAFWYFSGPLALLIIRKPGAAVYVNLVGAVAELVLGNPYSFASVAASAALQGVAAEIPFAVFRYRRYNLPLTIASGVVTAIEYGLYLIVTMYQGRGAAYLAIHMVSELVGGVLIAGVMSWWLFTAIAGTGALDHLASGRARRI